MKLLCVSRYRGTVDPHTDEQGEFTAGQEIDVPTEVGEYLMRCSPSSFVANDEPEAAIPSRDRRQRGGRVRG